MATDALEDKKLKFLGWRGRTRAIKTIQRLANSLASRLSWAAPTKIVAGNQPGNFLLLDEARAFEPSDNFGQALTQWCFTF